MMKRLYTKHFQLVKTFMYYRSPGNLNPILPRSNLTPVVVADNFDERTVINDDLNMNGYFILISKIRKTTKMLQQRYMLIQNNITSTALIS